MPRSASVVAEINGEVVRYAIATFAEGARAGRTGNIGSAGYRFHRAPEWWELERERGCFDRGRTGRGDTYYLRIRQANDE